MSGTQSRTQKLVAAQKGVGMGMGVTLRTFSLFIILNARTAHPKNHGLMLNAPKHVFWWQLVS